MLTHQSSCGRNRLPAADHGCRRLPDSRCSIRHHARPATHIIAQAHARGFACAWVAAQAVRASKGSRARLFALIYGVGVAVTIFLSNDATAVVLTPAVLAAVRAAEADPLPYLLICAFIANGASFVLPISNPANLVVYGHRLPSLAPWLATFALPSAASIVVTFVVLRWLSSKRLQGPIQTSVAGLALRFKRRE